MTSYLAVIHKEPASSYGISFPDVPGVVAAADTLDEVIAERPGCWPMRRRIGWT